MIPAASKWVLSYGLFCSALFYLSIPPSVTGVSSALPRLLLKLGGTEQQSRDLTRQLPTEGSAAYLPNVRVKRQNETGNGTEVDEDSNQKPQDGPGANNGTASAENETAGAENVTVAAQNVTSTGNIASTTSIASNNNSSEAPKLSSSAPKNTTDSSADTGERGVEDDEISLQEQKGPRYSLPTKAPFDRDLVDRLPERVGDDEAIVETRPQLLHPFFTTYILIVTLPCVVGWCLLTFVCLWICRPNSPLYREILKRLIEHSQMKQKSVLFSATVLAADRHPPATAAPTPGEGPSKA